MKKIILIVLSLIFIACAPSSIGTDATPSPTLDYESAKMEISVKDLKEACKNHFIPLGDPKFSAKLVVVDEIQNPGTIHANIYPVFQVVGKPNTTVQFGPGDSFPNAYRTIDNKVYLLAGADRINTTNTALKQNDGVIGYLAQFEVSFDFSGQPKSTETIGCFPIKK